MNRRDGIPILVNDDAAELDRIELGAGKPGALDERWLQRLIFEHPACLPIREIEPGFDALVSVCWELPTRHGPIDNLFMTVAGEIVIAEAKLWRNPQARREVVAQALDYASCLFEMGYDEFQAAVLKGSFEPHSKPESLYALLADQGAPAEQEFVDAVSLNLRRGRIVVLVVGDGIRAETERLAAGLQSHAGFHFTFALVELAVYRLPGNGGLLVMPRTLARTAMVERGVVRVDGGRISVQPAREPVASTGRTGTISAEQFFEAMSVRDPRLPDLLKAFIGRLEVLGVYPEFQKSLNLKWEPPSGKAINLGYIKRNGEVWTDAANWFVSPQLSHAYIENLAAAWDAEVDRTTLGGNWHVRMNGKAPRIEAVANRLDAWHDAMARFVDAVRGCHAGD